MSTGGVDDPAHPPRDDGSPGSGRAPYAGEASTPWERPRRWAHDRSDATRVEDLVARLSGPDPQPETRRSHRGGDPSDDRVAASELIAALSAPEESSPEPADPDTTAPDEPGGPGGPGGPAEGPPGEAEPDIAESDAPTDAIPAVPAGDDGYPEYAESDPPRQGEPQPVGAVPADSSWESVLGSLQRQVGTQAVAAAPRTSAPRPVGGHSPVHADGPNRGWLAAGRSAVAVFAVLLLLATGTEWVIKVRAEKVLAGRSVSAVVTDDTAISTPTVVQTVGAGGTTQAAAPTAYPAQNILLMGSDTRMTTTDASIGGSGMDTMQSDVLMVAHLSADRSHVTVVSIPRDLYVKAPTCKAWDYRTKTLSDKDYVSPYDQWKITNAFSVGGPQCTVRAVQQLTGLRIDRVIIIDFGGFKSMVDALDGITIKACRPIVDGQLGTVIAHAGVQHIDGAQALALVRARKVQGDTGGDLSRIHRQQMVLSILLRQATSAGVLLNPVKLNSLLQAFVHNVWTDNATLDDLLNVAQSLGDLNPSHVTFYTLPTVSDGTGLDMTSEGPIIWNALVNDELLPGEVTEEPTASATAPPSSSPGTPSPITSVITQLVTSTPQVPQVLAVSPSDVDLQIVNVSGRGGVATAAMKDLNQIGFQVASPDLLLVPGDVRTGVTVEYSAGNRDAAVTVAAAVPGATLVAADGLGQRVRLLLGSSFDGTVTAVTVGAPVPVALATTPSPVVQTVLSTQTITPSVAPTVGPPPTKSGPATLSSVSSVNAAQADCF